MLVLIRSAFGFFADSVRVSSTYDGRKLTGFWYTGLSTVATAAYLYAVVKDKTWATEIFWDVEGLLVAAGLVALGIDGFSAIFKRNKQTGTTDLVIEQSTTKTQVSTTTETPTAAQ
jgi:hypothetical protein